MIQKIRDALAIIQEGVQRQKVVTPGHNPIELVIMDARLWDLFVELINEDEECLGI